MTPTKPPTQVASVQGIAPKPIELTPAPVDWAPIVALPPFQMYAAEMLRNTAGKDAMAHAADLVRARGAGRDVLDDYCRWHAAKGYWPNETPLGELVA